jgi:uncharacterized protein YdcH (DUF465 family)
MIEILRNPQPQLPLSPAGGAQSIIGFVSLVSSTIHPPQPRCAAHPRGFVAPMQRGGRLMFENQQQDVENLIKSDHEFRSLYQRHQELDSKVRDAELGVLPLDDTTLHNMKKEKLWAKDKLTTMWERLHATH